MTGLGRCGCARTLAVARWLSHGGENTPIRYCAICKQAIRDGERSARYYLPITPERIRRAHVACIERERANAAHEDLMPGVVG
jgi:hypothetical protein